MVVALEKSCHTSHKPFSTNFHSISFVIPAELALDQIGERESPGETISNQTIFVIPDLIRDPGKLLHIKFSTTVPKELRGLEVNSFFALTIVSP